MAECAARVRKALSLHSIMGAFAAAVLALVPAGATRADTFDNFSYTYGGDTFTWQLPASPTIAVGEFGKGNYFEITGVPYAENGITETNPGVLDFFALGDMGGLELYQTASKSVVIEIFGTQLYAGVENAPSFADGTYVLNNGDPSGPLGTLVISTPPVDAPEPGSMWLLGAGLLALLGGINLRRRVGRKSSAHVS